MQCWHNHERIKKFIGIVCQIFWLHNNNNLSLFYFFYGPRMVSRKGKELTMNATQREHARHSQSDWGQINVMKKLLGNYSYCQQRNPPHVYLVAVLKFFFFDTFALVFLTLRPIRNITHSQGNCMCSYLLTNWMNNKENHHSQDTSMKE